MKRSMMSWGLVMLFVAGLFGCATMGDQASSAPSLYKRLGGREGIAIVVGDFVGTMAADPA